MHKRTGRRRTVRFTAILACALSFAALASTVQAADSFQWVNQYGYATSDEYTCGCQRGSVLYLVGRFGPTVRLESWSVTTAGASLLWSYELKTSDGTGTITVTDVVATSVGIYVIGSVDTALVGCKHFGKTDGFIVMVDPAGRHGWNKQIGTSGDDSLNALIADADTLYMIGTTQGALAVQQAPAVPNSVILACDFYGAVLATKQYGGIVTPQRPSMGIDVAAAAHRLYAIIREGYSYYLAWLDPRTLDLIPANMTQYDGAGTHALVKIAADDYGVYAVTIDGDYYCAASVAKFDLSCGLVWSQCIVEPGGEAGSTTPSMGKAHGIGIIQSAGTLWVGGVVPATYYFPTNSGPGGSIFVHRIDKATGAILWTDQRGTSKADSVGGIVVASPVSAGARAWLFVLGSTAGTMISAPNQGLTDAFFYLLAPP